LEATEKFDAKFETRKQNLSLEKFDQFQFSFSINLEIKQKTAEGLFFAIEID